MMSSTVLIDERSVVFDGHVIPGRWLRDHGDDPVSLNPETKQRLVDTFAIPRDVAPLAVRIDGGRLDIDWSDGAHTGHSISTLKRLVTTRRAPEVRPTAGFRIEGDLDLWSSAPGVSWFDLACLDDDETWQPAIEHLYRYGWVAFDGAELGEAASARLAARIGYPRACIFGTLWNMNSGSFEHADSAYESGNLDVHTDGTYSHDAPGTIIFAQQLKTGEGGDSVLVDGFAAAHDFQVAEPEAADLLTRYSVRAHYIEPGVHLVAERPPLRVNEHGVLKQVSFNNYDRSPLLPAADVVDDVIEAYNAFRAVFSNPDRALYHEWAPGRMLVFDNWRCFHGRTGFTGERHFKGCYTNHEDLESAYRLAGLTPLVL
jgi:hypothetical protein